MQCGVSKKPEHWIEDTESVRLNRTPSESHQQQRQTQPEVCEDHRVPKEDLARRQFAGLALNDLLIGPYALRENDVNCLVQPQPGAYLLAGTNYHWRVGRAEVDMRVELRQWIGAGEYVAFWCVYTSSPHEAFEWECILYHDQLNKHRPLDNAQHPQRPDDSTWTCPHCRIYG